MKIFVSGAMFFILALQLLNPAKSFADCVIPAGPISDIDANCSGIATIAEGTIVTVPENFVLPSGIQVFVINGTLSFATNRVLTVPEGASVIIGPNGVLIGNPCNNAVTLGIGGTPIATCLGSPDPEDIPFSFEVLAALGGYNPYPDNNSCWLCSN